MTNINSFPIGLPRVEMGMYGPGYNVVAFGADPTGNPLSGGQTAQAIMQATQTAYANGGGTVYFPQGLYYIGETIVLPTATWLNVRWVGTGWGRGLSEATSDTSSVVICTPSMSTPIVSCTGRIGNWQVENLSFIGSGISGNIGFSLNQPEQVALKYVSIASCGDQAILTNSGDVLILDHVIAQGLLVTSGRSSIIGVIDSSTADEHYSYVEVTSSITVADGFGNICGIVTRNGDGRYDRVISEFNQIGWAITSASGGLNTLVGCRSEFNNGQGWEVDSPLNIFIGCQSYNNGLAATNTSPGFHITAYSNSFTACHSNAAAPAGGALISYTFQDSSSGTTNEVPNTYIGCWGAHDSYATDVFNFTGNSNKTIIGSVEATSGLQIGWATGTTHLMSAGVVPTITPSANAGTGATATLSTGSTDTCGQITINTGTSAAAGSLFTVTFATTYPSLPNVLLLPCTANAAPGASAAQFFVNAASSSASQFTVTNNNTTASSATFKWFYFVIG